MTTVGILALQGAVREHKQAFSDLGIATALVKMPSQLDDVDALVMPGGESTTVSLLLQRAELFEPIQKRLLDGMATFGTCAGMILLAQQIEDGRDDQKCFGAIDISVQRNGYGAQSASFEAEIKLRDDNAEPFPAVFIRAPRISRVGNDVEVLAEYKYEAVLCRVGSVLVSSFHPELSNDLRVHDIFAALLN